MATQAKKAPVKKAPAKKAATKKAAPAKKAPAKAATTKKSASTKKASSAKSVASVKKAPAKKAATKKAVAKQAPVKKAPAKKAATKAPAKKELAGKKPTATKSATTKSASTKATSTATKKSESKPKSPAKAPAVVVKETPAPKAPAAPKETKAQKAAAAKAEQAAKAIAAQVIDPIGGSASIRKAVPGKKAAPKHPVVQEDESNWKKSELEQVKKTLLKEAAELEEEISAAEQKFHSLIVESGEGAGDDQADAGTKTFEREQEISLLTNKRDLLDQTQHALARIEAGTYGLCENCGRHIGKVRLLEANPRATLCMPCREKEDRS